VHEQKRQQGALLGSAEWEQLAVGLDLKRP
jgi:hypothetical protein